MMTTVDIRDTQLMSTIIMELMCQRVHLDHTLDSKLFNVIHADYSTIVEAVANVGRCLRIVQTGG